MLTWKEKILDYEIETGFQCFSRFVCELEKRRYSITRLKQCLGAAVGGCVKLEKRRYSITRLKLSREPDTADWTFQLEKRRYSITRLKLTKSNENQHLAVVLKREDTRLRDWNRRVNPHLRLAQTHSLEKRRYSITRLKQHYNLLYFFGSYFAWKEKILDYEIETLPC